LDLFLVSRNINNNIKTCITLTYEKVKSNDHDEININEICDNPAYDEILNGKTTELEITEAIKELKNNKAAGTHNILNEYFEIFLSIERDSNSQR
jgi:hypothetical protein